MEFTLCIGQISCILCLMFSHCCGDYPPNDINYRLHPIDMYPREAGHSMYCERLPNGNYPHQDLDLGDPRCTFVMCSNERTVVHSCPGGTRTGFFYLPYIFKKAMKLSKKIQSSQDLMQELQQEFRNWKSDHGICDYYDYGGVCGNIYPDFNAFVPMEAMSGPAGESVNRRESQIKTGQRGNSHMQAKYQ